MRTAGPNEYQRDLCIEKWACWDIIWAYQTLMDQGKSFYWSDIRRISGVKKKNFQSIIPYLVKHTDTDTANRIITMIIA